jgi:hypothetical protein
MEGKFNKGQQEGFGRLLINEPMGAESKYINVDLSYTGWWPTEYQTGQGIGIIDNEIEYSGEW